MGNLIHEPLNCCMKTVDAALDIIEHREVFCICLMNGVRRIEDVLPSLCVSYR